MRKILALLLVTALIPFLTGCRIDGLWGYDDDDTVVTQNTAVTSARVVVDLSTAGFGAPASIRQALPPINTIIVQYMPNTVGATWQDMTASSTDPKIFYKDGLVPSQIMDHPTVAGAKYFRIKYLTGLETIDLPLPIVTEVSVSRGSTTITMTFTVTITDQNGELVATVAVLSQDSGVTVSGTTGGGSETVSGSAIAIATATVKVSGTDKFLSINPNDPTDLATNTVNGLEFTIGFNVDVASVTDNFTIELDRLPGTGKTTISKTSNADKLELTALGTKGVKVVIKTDQTLTTATHKVTVTQSSIVSAATPTIKLSDSLPMTFYIKQ